MVCTKVGWSGNGNIRSRTRGQQKPCNLTGNAQKWHAFANLLFIGRSLEVDLNTSVTSVMYPVVVIFPYLKMCTSTNHSRLPWHPPGFHPQDKICVLVFLRILGLNEDPMGVFSY